MESDRFHFIVKDCQIPPSDENSLLSLPATLFAREQPFLDDNDDGIHDTWPVSSDDDDAVDNTVTIAFCSPPPSPPDDDATAVGDDGGTNVGFPSHSPSVAVEKMKECENDDVTVVLGVPEELGFVGERKRARDELSLKLPSTTAKKLKLCDDGDEAAAVGGDRMELDESEIVLEKGKGKVHDTEELIVGDDSDKEEEDDDVVDTELNEEKSKEESSGEARKCLREVLRVLSEMNKGKGEDGEVDFLETAKRRGVTFPEPRWLRFKGI